MDTNLERGSAFVLFMVLLSALPSQAQLKESHLRRDDRVKWAQVLKVPSDCESRFATTSNDKEHSGLEFNRISEDKALVIVECYPGAYQPGVILYLLSEGPPQVAVPSTLDGVEADTNDDGTPLPYQMFDGLVSFNRRTNTLEVLQKGRGLGDCGRFLRYHFRGTKFVAFEVREQECRDKGELGAPDVYHWPLRPIPTAGK